jgi:hypothetical protein
MTDLIVYGGAVLFVSICALVGIWGNWSFLGKDGHRLPRNQTPGFLAFWISYLPREIFKGFWRRAEKPTREMTFAEALYDLHRKFERMYGRETLMLALSQIEYEQNMRRRMAEFEARHLRSAH